MLGEECGYVGELSGQSYTLPLHLREYMMLSLLERKYSTYPMIWTSSLSLTEIS